MNSVTDYDKITRAIEFFSQDLHEEQFSRYGYPFLHDLLDLEKSSLYMVRDFNDQHSPYILMNKVNAELDVKVIKNSKALNNLAVLHGRFLTNDFDVYLPNNLFSKISVNLLIPIINKSVLYGFIISEGKLPYKGSLDYIHVINIIVNMSLSHIVNQKTIEKRSSLLRSEVYNLNMLTHLIAEIVSEKNLNKLYNLCIDSVRELTASSYTTVVFYDEITESFVTKASKDIVGHNNLLLSYEIKSNDFSNMKKIFDIEEDFQALEKIFINAEQFKRINARYVLMMFDESLKGFITIGEAVNRKAIDESLLYKINTIAHFILIAVKNANYIKKIKTQNSLIENQLSTMKNLNEALTVINTCESLDELIDVVMMTLDIQFDIEKCFFISKWDNESKLFINEDDYENLIIDEEKLPMNFDYNYENDSVKKILNIDNHGHNCLIVAPIKIQQFNKEEIIGYLIITKVKEKLEEYQLTAIKTISQLITPVIKSYIKVKDIKKHYMIDEEELFLLKVEEAIVAKKEFDLEFYIQYKEIHQKPFQEKIKKESDIYKINNYSFRIVYSKECIDDSWHVIKINSIEELIQCFSN